jgi:hypothetical protein
MSLDSMFVETRLSMETNPKCDRVQSLVLLMSSLLVSTCAGCGFVSRGLLYTDTIQPLCKDLRGTTLGTKVGSGSSKRIEIPTTRIDVSAEWDSRAIGDIAKEHGISTVYGCDSRRQSYVLGIWRKDEVIIYGE